MRPARVCVRRLRRSAEGSAGHPSVGCNRLRHSAGSSREPPSEVVPQAAAGRGTHLPTEISVGCVSVCVGDARKGQFTVLQPAGPCCGWTQGRTGGMCRLSGPTTVPQPATGAGKRTYAVVACWCRGEEPGASPQPGEDQRRVLLLCISTIDAHPMSVCPVRWCRRVLPCQARSEVRAVR